MYLVLLNTKNINPLLLEADFCGEMQKMSENGQNKVFRRVYELFDYECNIYCRNLNGGHCKG